jgi:hypothetical protein
MMVAGFVGEDRTNAAGVDAGVIISGGRGHPQPDKSLRQRSDVALQSSQGEAAKEAAKSGIGDGKAASPPHRPSRTDAEFNEEAHTPASRGRSPLWRRCSTPFPR